MLIAGNRRRSFVRTGVASCLSGAKRIVQGWIELAAPNVCGVCGDPATSDRRSLCDPCEGEMAGWNQDLNCRQCGVPRPSLDGMPLSTPCRECARRRLPFEGVSAWGAYSGRLKDLARRLKIRRRAAAAGVAGELAAEAAAARFQHHRPHVVVPTPMHWTRRLERGFPAADTLAFYVSRRLGWPLRRGVLGSRRRTRKQGTLSDAARLENTRGAFRGIASTELRNASVLLVDDILTTGATASSATRALLAAGACEVRVAVLARAVPRA